MSRQCTYILHVWQFTIGQSLHLCFVQVGFTYYTARYPVNSPTDQLADANSPTYKIEQRRQRVDRNSTAHSLLSKALLLIEKLPRINAICSSRSPEQAAKILFYFLPQIVTCSKTLFVAKAHTRYHHYFSNCLVQIQNNRPH